MTARGMLLDGQALGRLTIALGPFVRGRLRTWNECELLTRARCSRLGWAAYLLRFMTGTPRPL